MGKGKENYFPIFQGCTKYKSIISPPLKVIFFPHHVFSLFFPFFTVLEALILPIRVSDPYNFDVDPDPDPDPWIHILV